MADVAFPASPSNNDTHSEGGTTWQYNSTLNAWLVLARTDGVLTTADLLDEDDMTSDSATKVPTQQSVKAYVDNTAAGVSSVNGVSGPGAIVIDPDDIDDSLTANKFATAAQLAKVDAISTWAATLLDDTSASAARNTLGVFSKYEPADTVTGTTYSLLAADAGQLLIFSNAAQVTVTVPTNATTAISTGFRVVLQSVGAGGLTLSTTGVTLNGSGVLTTIAQNEALYLEKTATDTWTVLGGTS